MMSLLLQRITHICSQLLQQQPSGCEEELGALVCHGLLPNPKPYVSSQLDTLLLGHTVCDGDHGQAARL
jgi:hypothetical protein